MRKAGIGLALVASAQLTLLSSPAFAEDQASGSASASLSTSGSSGSADAKGGDKKTTGWILIGAGGALTIGGIVVNVVGANSGSVAGESGGQTDNTRSDLYIVGTTMIVAGIVAGIYGGSLVWNASKGTDPKASDRPSDRPAGDEDSKSDSVTRSVQARLQSAPSFMIPVVQASF